MDLLQRVRATIEQHQLLEPEDCIIVAVSGGPDSMALLHILFLLAKKQRWRMIAAHVNHQFRVTESAREAEEVERFASSLGLPCIIGVINVPDYINKTGKNAQTAAREKRYEFLLQAAARYGATKIVTAHHADDQAETILMRLLRGTGPSGLAGIPLRRKIKNVELIRPLLRIYKTEVLEYCREHNINFFIDSSNLDRKYTRNQVRNDLLPVLLEYNPHLPEALNRLTQVMTDENAYLDQAAEAVFNQNVKSYEGGLYFTREPFILLHVALQRRLIKLILSCLAPNYELDENKVSNSDSVDFAKIELIRSAIMQNVTTTLNLDITEQIRLMREYNQISFGKSTLSAERYHYIVDIKAEELTLNEAGIRLEFTVFEDYHSEHAIPDGELNNQAIFDYNQLQLPLTIRSRQDGDRIRVLGLNGSKKVKDIFIDEKVSPRQRNQIPLVVDAMNKILWITGFRRSDHALTSKKTTRFLRIKLVPLKDNDQPG
jgi:tRNA(Ile)-lysidine synthase